MAGHLQRSATTGHLLRSPDTGHLVSLVTVTGGGCPPGWCPPGFTWSEDLQQCVPATTGPVPEAPAAPECEKDCQAGTILIVAPDWPVEPAVLATTMRLRRSADNGATWTVIHTWTEPGGDYTDAVEFGPFIYACQALNANGGSAWGPASAPVSLLSDTLTITWLEPAAGVTLANKALLWFQLADAGEPRPADCPPFAGSGGCWDSAADVQLFVDGLPALVTITRESGTERNGIYRAVLDTRDYANGARALRAVATGTDCCPAKAERAVTLNNSLRRGTLYLQQQWLEAPPLGQQWNKAGISLENAPLYAAARRRYWVRSALTTDAAKLVDWAAENLTAQAKADAFDALQQVTMQRKQSSATPERTQYAAVPDLAPGGVAIYWVQQWNPAEVLSAWEPGCERIESIIEEIPGAYLVFARNSDDSAAKLFRFTINASTGAFALTLLVDFADHAAPDVSNIARLADKVFAVRPGELFAVDLDSGQATINLAPRGETRAPLLVCNAGGKALALFVDANLSEARTRCYDLTFAAPRLLWSLDEAATRVAWLNNTLVVAAGAQLFSAPNNNEAPMLVHTFSAPITSLDACDDYSLIGLQNGEVWKLTGGDWALLTTLPAAVNAASAWEGSGDEWLAVAGAETAQLHEELSGGAWTDARAILPPDGMNSQVSAITALARFEKITQAAQGTPGEPEFVPEKKIAALLIGSAPDGLLLALELSEWNAARGALLASRVGCLNIDPYARAVLD